jgi:N-acetylmuramoyl-L-alanine amidase
MRAEEFLGEKWSDWKGLAAYGAMNAAVAGANHAGYIPDWIKDQPTAQQQVDSSDEDDSDYSSISVELPDAQPYQAKAKQTQDHVTPSDVGTGLSKDAKLLALTIWGEARGEGQQGMLAVGHVIENRMNSDRFGGSVADVVWKPKAFSCWNPSDPNREKMREIAALPKDSVEYQALEAGEAHRSPNPRGQHQRPDRWRSVLSHHRIKPFWADPSKAIARVANHIFYKNDPSKPLRLERQPEEHRVLVLLEPQRVVIDRARCHPCSLRTTHKCGRLSDGFLQSSRKDVRDEAVAPVSVQRNYPPAFAHVLMRAM